MSSRRPAATTAASACCPSPRRGEALERRLFERQREWVMRAYREAGPIAVEGFRRVMRGLMGPEARAQLERLEQPSPTRRSATSLARTG